MKTLAEKIIRGHLLEGRAAAGEEITIKLDQCLLQDATGTLAWLEYEALKSKKVNPFVVQYVDHNLMQADNKNMDDHLFLMTITSKYGAYFSMPGNGISHHIHKERFTKPGQTMIGCDSHTSSSGGSAMIAIGTGGMDVAVGMSTGKYTFSMPEIVGVKLTGRLKPWSTAKDVILEILRRVNVDGGKGKILEYFGQGVKTLNVSERSTICNMGAETGATTSIFPSDEQTKRWFALQKRGKDYAPLQADKKAEYSDVIEIELGKIEPLISCPHSPGNVKQVREVAGIEVHQSMIGSSTNSSYEAFMRASKMVSKKLPHRRTAFHVIPGSRQLLETIAQNSGFMSLMRAGARIAEPSCNACIGMGNAPASETVSVRSFPRNWEGRSGTVQDSVFLSSPETAVACAIRGEITDPRDIGISWPKVAEPKYVIDDGMILLPKFMKEVRRGPNIKKLQYNTCAPDRITGEVLLKMGNDISTDHIMPAGAKILPLRSNIPEISKFVFHYLDPSFYERCVKAGGGILVGGENYGQGSSREHAAIAPMHLGIKAVIAKAYARIHRKNLINFGILPLEFSEKSEYKKVSQGDVLEIRNIRNTVKEKNGIILLNKTKNTTISCRLPLERKERDIISCGGFLNYVKKKGKCE